MDTIEQATADARSFFTGYRDALLSRDVDRIAALFHEPLLVAFPGDVRAVTDPAGTRAFFRAPLGQYDGVTAAEPVVEVVAASDASIWADVTWHYRGPASGERFVYQLLRTAGGWRIGVLTPR